MHFPLSIAFSSLLKVTAEANGFMRHGTKERIEGMESGLKKGGGRRRTGERKDGNCESGKLEKVERWRALWSRTIKSPDLVSTGPSAHSFARLLTHS